MNFHENSYHDPKWGPSLDPADATAKHFEMQRRRTVARNERVRTNTLQQVRDFSPGRYPSVCHPRESVEYSRTGTFERSQARHLQPFQCSQNWHLHPARPPTQIWPAQELSEIPLYAESPGRYISHENHRSSLERFPDPLFAGVCRGHIDHHQPQNDFDREKFHHWLDGVETPIQSQPETIVDQLIIHKLARTSDRTARLVRQHCPTLQLLESRYTSLQDVASQQENKSLRKSALKTLSKRLKAKTKRRPITVKAVITNPEDLAYLFGDGGLFHSPDPEAFVSPQLRGSTEFEPSEAQEVSLGPYYFSGQAEPPFRRAERDFSVAESNIESNCLRDLGGSLHNNQISSSVFVAPESKIVEASTTALYQVRHRAEIFRQQNFDQLYRHELHHGELPPPSDTLNQGHILPITESATRLSTEPFPDFWQVPQTHLGLLGESQSELDRLENLPRLEDPFGPSQSQTVKLEQSAPSKFTEKLLSQKRKTILRRNFVQKTTLPTVSALTVSFEAARLGISSLERRNSSRQQRYLLHEFEWKSRTEQSLNDFDARGNENSGPAPQIPTRSASRNVDICPDRKLSVTVITESPPSPEITSSGWKLSNSYISNLDREQALRRKNEAAGHFPLWLWRSPLKQPDAVVVSELELKRSRVVYSPSIYSQPGRDFTLSSLVPSLVPAPLSVSKTSSSLPRLASFTTTTTPIRQRQLGLCVKPCKDTEIFWGDPLAATTHCAKMETLNIPSRDRSTTKMKAVEDARQMQVSVIETAKKAGKDPPKYVLLELIGKGSFGRVYKGKDMTSAAIVAVKIIDIDESDTLNPRLADTYSEFMKEVNTLKILTDKKARNINHVIEALPVGKAMWLITEYCGGGSIATVMKPTPHGLKEKFIIPILREVAEAVKWVHQAGIIHRDLKCANVLITEDGGVQLCDFGVSGFTENPLDKRNTFIGTPHWMAPEIFMGQSYGKEVDIWAFGSMAFEMATGLPPNAREGFGGADFNHNPQMIAVHLEKNLPRLDGPRYSDGLRDLVDFCLQFKSIKRPAIQQVQRHPYIWDTEVKYPASSLSDLVMAFKLWEEDGGSRKSLFMLGGAQNASEQLTSEVMDDNWNFSTTASFDQAVAEDTRPRGWIDDVYGQAEYSEDTSRPVPRSTRRRPPPEALAPLRAPLEKVFDQNTISNYDDNSRSHYGQGMKPASDLPLRDDTAQTSIRDTMIDLGGHDAETGMSNFPEMDTIKARHTRGDSSDDDFEAGPMIDYSRPALSDPADNPNRRTQDWTFPSMANPPATANPEVNRFPGTYDLQRPLVTPGSGSRPPLVHHPTEPISLPSVTNSLMPSAPASPSRLSLIDLDLSLPEPSRPSTADSTASQEMTSADPFSLEHHTSLYNNGFTREPSLYLPDGSSLTETMNIAAQMVDINDVSDFSASDAEGGYINVEGNRARQIRVDNGSSKGLTYSQFAMPYPLNIASAARTRGGPHTYSMDHFPVFPTPPSADALSGTATDEEMAHEMQRMLGGLTSQLESFRDVYDSLPRREREKGAW